MAVLYFRNLFSPFAFLIVSIHLVAILPSLVYFNWGILFIQQLRETDKIKGGNALSIFTGR